MPESLRTLTLEVLSFESGIGTRYRGDVRDGPLHDERHTGLVIASSM